MLFTSIFKFKKRELTDSPPDITATNDNWDKAEEALLARVEKSQIKDNLTETEAGNVLDARQGKALNDKIEAISIPTSLPANGGNADTVDGKHASEFAPSTHTHDDRYYTEEEMNNSFMKINQWGNDVFGNDLNNWKKAGSWWCSSSTINVPIGDGWGTVLIYGTGDRVTQVFNAWNYNQTVRYVRMFNVNAWSDWRNAGDGGTAYRLSVSPNDYDTVPIEIGRYIDFHIGGSSADYDGRLQLQDGALVFVSPSKPEYNINIPYEINNLKSSVVSGKQLVVNAINDKLGYASGLTTSHTFADYYWWIMNMINHATINYDTAVAALKLYYSSSGYTTVAGGGTVTVPEDGYVFVWKNVYSTWTCVSGSMVRFSAGETHESMGSSTYCYKVTAGTVIKNGMTNGQYIFLATQSKIRSLMGVTLK